WGRRRCRSAAVTKTPRGARGTRGGVAIDSIPFSSLKFGGPCGLAGRGGGGGGAPPPPLQKRTRKGLSIRADEVVEVRAEEALLRQFRMLRQARLESADRIAAAFGMRIIGRKQVEAIVRLANQLADILERVWREAKL